MKTTLNTSKPSTGTEFPTLLLKVARVFCVLVLRREAPSWGGGSKKRKFVCASLVEDSNLGLKSPTGQLLDDIQVDWICFGSLSRRWKSRAFCPGGGLF